MLPDIQYIGEDTLQKGWQRPTRGLLQRVLLFNQEGIAPPNATHVHQQALPALASLSAEVRGHIAALAAFVDPSSGSLLQAVGMAYPQLNAAQNGSLRIFSAMLGMPDLDVSSRRKGKVFINPVVTPIKSGGRESDIEMCFSCPGLAVTVDRWKVVKITSDDREPQRLQGVEARIAQHELDHLNGILCVNRATRRGDVIYYVPPEVRRSFFDEFVKKNRLNDWPFIFPRNQWWAMMEGIYSLATYTPLL